MRTLKKIKKYLKEQETKTLTSKRGNTYEIITLDKKTIDQIKNFKTLITSYHYVNSKKLINVSWLENGKIINVYALEGGE